jgi:photosystem II stability/assembly factor-like uncharacterized protein
MHTARFLPFLLPFLLMIGCRESIQLRPIGPPLISDARIDLRAIGFTPTGQGYAVGGYRFDHTVLLGSSDAGQSWESQQPIEPIDRVMYGLLVRDEASALTGGLHDLTLRTLDRGATWRFGYIPDFDLNVPVRNFAAIDDTTIIMVCGGGYNAGSWYRSQNFGLTWDLIDTVGYELRDVVFTSPTVGYSCGYGVIFKTSDGGEQWELTPAEDDFFVSLSFPTAEIGYAVGRSGTILKTTDAAASWETLRNGNNLLNARHRYNQVHFISPQRGYAVGDQGLLVKTSDGGQSWQRFDTDTKADLYQIAFQQAGKGTIVGEGGLLMQFEE